MRSNDGAWASALFAREFAAFWAALVLAVLLSARPVEAWHFVYVTNSNNVTVIDTNTNTVVTRIPVGIAPSGVAVAPDGKHVYVANSDYSHDHDSTVSVINTATNTVVATFTVLQNPYAVAVSPDGRRLYVTAALRSDAVSVIDTATNTQVAVVGIPPDPIAIAVTPDGKRAYVVSNQFNVVIVIDTNTNTEVARVPVGSGPSGVAVTPDGKLVYVANVDSNNVSVIDTATDNVLATVPAGITPLAVAITPDGTRAYVTNVAPSVVSVIDTASNSIVATVPVGTNPRAVAITPDGKNAYVGGGNVSVIDTATNTVVATVPVGGGSVATFPPPSRIPFSAFRAKLEIDRNHEPNEDDFHLQSEFTLGQSSNGINPPAEPVTLRIGGFATTIPPGSFKGKEFGPFEFEGVVNHVRLEVSIEPTGAKRYRFHANAHDASLNGTVNPVTVTLTVGTDTGTTSVEKCGFSSRQASQ
jgi:YVTN family beta-propeller protein